MALGDVYKIVDRMTQANQTSLNVYFYRALVAGTDAEELAQVFQNEVLVGVRGLQGSGTNHNAINVENLFDDSDFVTSSISLNGTNLTGGEAMAPHDAFTYTLNPTSKVVRPGGKRYVGMGEDYQLNGTISGSLILNPMEALRLLLIEILKDLATGLIDHYVPVIVKRIKSGTPPNVTYRLPVNQTENVDSIIKTAEFSPFVSSQVSRKIRL